MNSGAEKQRKALGKGLSALLPSRAANVVSDPPPTSEPSRVPIGNIHPNPMQPRTIFQPDKLEELALSIRAEGIIQPLVVRRKGAEFEIVAGERRWRAAQLAGLTDVPVVVQDIDTSRMLEIALVENIQREDLNAIEMAEAYERLHRELGLSYEEIGRRTGKDRTSIANTVRLLKLPREVQGLVADQRLWAGHARAILALPTAELQIEVAEKATAQGLSVRQVEALVQSLTSEHAKPASNKREISQDANVRAAVDNLERALGTRVRIVELTEQRGRIEIEYFSQSELERLFQQLTGEH